MEIFRALAGLPSTGPWPEQFSATGLGTHSEGFVVEFHPGTSSSWVGNFQRGGSHYDNAVLHPDGRSIVVVAGGQGYFVDPKTRHLLGVVGGHIEEAFFVASGRTLLLNNGLWIEGYSESGLLWRTRRISWDGLWDLREQDGRLHGKSWDAARDVEEPFSLDICTGEVSGGAYPVPPGLAS